jgi:Ser/Thr protein kinase RdoA (MazF antagonist)
MWSVDRTVDIVTMRGRIADQLIARWGTQWSARMMRSSANFTYRGTDGTRTAFLRFAHAGDRSAGAIEQEMQLLTWLGEQGIAANQPILSSAGRLVESVETEAGTFHAVLLTEITGVNHELDQLDAATAERWGAAIGELHATLVRAPESLRRGPGFWHDSLTAAAGADSPFPDMVRREVRSLIAELEKLSQTPETYGLIHSDLELDNVFDQGARFGIIDFDEYCAGWLTLDLAKAFTDGLSLNPGEEHPLFPAFIAGYRGKHPLSDATLDTIPLMLRVSELNGYVRVHRSLNLDPSFQRIDWLAGLERRLGDWLREYEAVLGQP